MAQISNRFSKSALLALSALCVIPAGQAFAQTAPAAGTTVDTEEIVVNAQRRSQNIQDVPVSVQAFSAQTLQDRGVAQVQDLQNIAPNVTIASPLGQGAAPAINIRGIGLNDFNTNNSGPNGVYVDEFAVSSPNAQGLSFFDLDHVEVLKGPQGTLYGRNSSGGAVNITTARPTQEFTAFARAAFSSFDTLDTEGAISGPLSSTLSGRLSGMYRYSDGFMYNHLYNRHENGVNMFGLRGQLLWEPNNDFSALLKVQDVENDTRSTMYKQYGVLDPTNPAAAGADRSTWCSISAVYSSASCVDFTGYAGRSGFWEGDWDNGNDKVHLVDRNATLRMQYDFGNGLNLVSVTGYNDNDSFHPEQTDANPLNILAIDFGAHSREYTQELRLSHDSDRLNWVLGTFFIHEGIDQDQPAKVLLDGETAFGLPPGSFDGVAYIQQGRNRQSLDSEAVFGQAEFHLTDQWSLIAGARYTASRMSFDSFQGTQFQDGGPGNFGPLTMVSNIHNNLTEDNFSWRLGTQYRLSDDAMLFATVSTGYKAGGFNGGFLSQDPVERALQLQPFKPETVTAYEAGFKSEWFDRAVTFNASVFYNDYKDQQVSILRIIPDPTQITGTRLLFALANADEAEIRGLDADLTWHVTPDFSLSTQVGLLDATFTSFVTADADYSGNRLSLAPKVTGTIAANYEHDFGFTTLHLGYDATYRSRQFFEPTNDPYIFQDSYWLQNARIGLSFDDEHVEIAAFARNFANEKYFIWDAGLFDPFGVLTATVGAPRSVGVELRYTY